MLTSTASIISRLFTDAAVAAVFTGLPVLDPAAQKKEKAQEAAAANIFAPAGGDGKKQGRKARRKNKRGTKVDMNEMLAALNEEEEKPKPKVALPRATPKSNRRAVRQKLEEKGALHFKQVLAMEQFQANPFDAIALHLKNTVGAAKQ